MWVIFEGLDKSGKTTLEYALLKRTNYEHIVIDRGPAGYLTYDGIFGRVTGKRLVEFNKQARLINLLPRDFVVVYCKVPYDVAVDRLAENNEECPYDYKLAQTVYDRNISDLYSKKVLLELDTTKSIESCIDEIIKKIEEVRAF